MDPRVPDTASEGLQDPVLDAVQRRGLCTQKETRQSLQDHVPRLGPSPSMCTSTLVLSSLLKSTSYCMGADSYLFMKLFWNSYSTTNLSYVFFRERAFIDKL